MELSIYLAYTGAEAELMGSSSEKTAWLGCRLSPYGTGISVAASAIPSCHMLILTDETPIADHDPNRVAQELIQQAERLGCEKLLIDFQRHATDQSAAIVNAILDLSPIPVGVSEGHAKALPCPVFLTTPPLWDSLESHIHPWSGREIWLEAAAEDGCICVTNEGCTNENKVSAGEFPYYDRGVCTAYQIVTEDDKARFYLHRGALEMQQLLSKARQLGIETAIGLYQQLKEFSVKRFP